MRQRFITQCVLFNFHDLRGFVSCMHDRQVSTRAV